MDADQDLKRAINEGWVIGPRMIITSRAIVSTGGYEPKGALAVDHADWGGLGQPSRRTRATGLGRCGILHALLGLSHVCGPRPYSRPAHSPAPS